MQELGGDAAGGVLAQVERAACVHFGSVPARASVSFLGVEPIEVLRFAPESGSDLISLMTLGLSRRPMGDGSSAGIARGQDGTADSGSGRAELIAQVRAGSIDGAADLWRRLAVLAAAPVVEGVVYAPGMSVDLGEPLVAGSRCTGGLIESFELSAIATVLGEVTLLRFVPATSTELAHCRVNGAPDLTRRWHEAGTDLFDLGRSAVALG